MRASQLVGLVWVLTSAACAHSKPAQGPVPAFDMRGVLVSTAELKPPFSVQQRIHGKYQGGEATMDCVVQLKDGKLTVLGLTPFGTRAFVIEQTGTEVHFEKYVDRDLPVAPEAVLYDIHRVFFRGLRPGQLQGQDNGDLVTERYVDGHITERRFQSLEGPVTNLVVVTFEGAPAPIIAPRVHITNSAYAYSLDIENSEQKTLGGSYTLEVETVAPPPGATDVVPDTSIPPAP